MARVTGFGVQLVFGQYLIIFALGMFVLLDLGVVLWAERVVG